jgi:hypothetical protein
MLFENILAFKDNFIVVTTARHIFLSHRQLYSYPRTAERTEELYGLLLKHMAYLALSLQTIIE